MGWCYPSQASQRGRGEALRSRALPPGGRSFRVMVSGSSLRADKTCQKSGTSPLDIDSNSSFNAFCLIGTSLKPSPGVGVLRGMVILYENLLHDCKHRSNTDDMDNKRDNFAGCCAGVRVVVFSVPRSPYCLRRTAQKAVRVLAAVRQRRFPNVRSRCR